MAPAATLKGKAPTLKTLQMKLKRLQTSFNNMYRFMEEWSENTKISEFSVRHDRLEPLWDEMNDAIDEFASHEENTDAESAVKERMDFENRFFELKALLIDRLKDVPEAAALNQSQLGHTHDIASRRFLQIKRRLERDSELKKQYHDFMQEYEQLGHMRRVPDDDVATTKRYYLPHHPVVKESSTTTRVRVVYDASCKSSSGVSLNDALSTGPVVQEDLRSITLRSRTRLVLLIADVKKISVK
ncbi:uncharacterized protein LOC129719959 [Wyeomyia smithii]|uniref:uncharacterized protein LOC129719959 n=1 Tax=Wyeomyia smithii TaxID=174621 RepID=UPI002467C8C3|nr:uncharacterized protein LOC129719959 [Wyeomyia smithii]